MSANGYTFTIRLHCTFGSIITETYHKGSSAVWNMVENKMAIPRQIHLHKNTAANKQTSALFETTAWA